MPLRKQWNENRGYCGEDSTIATAMKYGSYFSQYDMREISDMTKFDTTIQIRKSKTKTLLKTTSGLRGSHDNTNAFNSAEDDNSQVRSEYLVGVNDLYAAKQLRLDANQWDNSIRDVQKHLLWIKRHVMAGHAVTATVFLNHYLFYGDTDPTAGDDDYDHIVSVESIESNYPESDVYHEDDVITFSDHALWFPSVVASPRYLFSYSFKEFQGTRRQANAENGQLYTLCDETRIGNFAIAHLGVTDENGFSVPVRLESSFSDEVPEIAYLSNTRPEPMPTVLSVYVRNLTEGKSYNLYKYANETIVPTSKFNSNAHLASATWTVLAPDGIAPSDELLVLKDSVLSSDRVLYRCVPSDAP